MPPPRSDGPPPPPKKPAKPSKPSSTKRKGRRARGTGTIFYDPARGTWIGRKKIGGVKIERWGKTQAEVIKKLDAAAPPGPETTVAALADKWLESLADRKPATLISYGVTVQHVKKHLGTVRVRDLTPTRIEAFTASLIAGGMHTNTARRTVGELRNLLSGSVRDGIIPTNPAVLARKPKARPKKIDPFTPNELSTIIAACDADTTYPIALLASAGCRIGEALALDVSDWNRATGEVTITKTYDRQVGTGTPKSERGVRTIRVPLDAHAALSKAAGKRKSGPLFESGSGNRRIADLVRQAWGRLLDSLSMRRRNPHQLRHSVATAMIGAGVPIADVAKYLGDTPDTLVKTYVHPTGVDPSAAMDKLLGGRKVGGIDKSASNR